MLFRELNLNPDILAALEAKGYETPTPIQAGAIPPLLEGRDVWGCAQTGTGKTAAFALPILHQLASRPFVKTNAVRALILSPTRELALQIAEQFVAYGKGLRMRSTVIFGGVGDMFDTSLTSNAPASRSGSPDNCDRVPYRPLFREANPA
jgi:ATP-dependent RNA helicase RhlE